MIHRNNDYSAMGASEKRGHPGSGVGSPEHHAVASANFACVEFAGETVSGGGEVAVGGSDHTIAVGLGKSCFSAETSEVRQVIGDARSLHHSSVTHLAAWVNRRVPVALKAPCADQGASHRIPPFWIPSFPVPRFSALADRFIRGFPPRGEIVDEFRRVANLTEAAEAFAAYPSGIRFGCCRARVT